MISTMQNIIGSDVVCDVFLKNKIFEFNWN